MSDPDAIVLSRATYDRIMAVVRKVENLRGASVNQSGIAIPPPPGVKPRRWSNAHAWFVVQHVDMDWLECYFCELVPNSSGMGPPEQDVDTSEIVYVALPPQLQQSPWAHETIDGLAYSFNNSTTPAEMITTRASDSTTETHIIAPPYRLPQSSGYSFQGELIKAVQISTGLVDPKGNDIVWIDDGNIRDWRTPS